MLSLLTASISSSEMKDSSLGGQLEEEAPVKVSSQKRKNKKSCRANCPVLPRKALTQRRTQPLGDPIGTWC